MNELEISLLLLEAGDENAGRDSVALANEIQSMLREGKDPVNIRAMVTGFLEEVLEDGEDDEERDNRIYSYAEQIVSLFL